MSRAVFDPKSPQETKNYIFDFLSLLSSGETILTASMIVSLYSGGDINPSSMVNGNPVINGTKVAQSIQGGSVGNVYNLSCTITTSSGQSLIMGGFCVVQPTFT